ncbi:CPBP family intramembrane metalloprotease [Labilibaculum sp. A4]|uniref:CPBP family intramembrane glutamic endopeptidase n=1 Tax=Labilibaculum euxinus TaxID=2686357 RepID=UPI000F623A74|nr:type II CAAX endopeptidase family protein [Labilibaculum euxinus]MDQ1772343.1 type II CAAX endopeptidase family protein [Labilibaculum euxinus]MWN77959.1 CPBP family intramembrane metalloprotease [Labilibaculum euxinus]
MNPTNNEPAIKRGWLRAILILLPFIIFTGIFQLIGTFVLALASNKDLLEMLQNQADNSTSSFLVIQFFGTIGTLLLIWLFTRFIDRKKMIDLGLSFQKRAKDIIYGLLAGFIMMGAGSLILYFSGNLTFNSITFNLIGLAQSVVLFILVSINEEVFVRGYLLRNFMDSMNKYIALISSSLIFMALHLMNPNVSLVGITNIFLAGLLLGIGYIFTKNLWFPLALHFSWNFFQGPIFGFEVSGTSSSSLISQSIHGNEILTGGQFGLEGSIIATVLCSLGIVLFWMVYKKQNVLSTAN